MKEGGCGVCCSSYNFLHGNRGGLEAGIVIVDSLNHVGANAEDVHHAIVALRTSAKERCLDTEVLGHTRALAHDAKGKGGV